MANVVVETTDLFRLEVSAGNASTVVDRSGNPDAVGFHSVDLMLAGLGSCMIGTMLSAAQKDSIHVESARVELRPYVALNPERVSRVKMKLAVVGDISPAQLAILKQAAESCKVHNSLHRGVGTELEISISPAPAPAALVSGTDGNV